MDKFVTDYVTMVYDEHIGAVRVNWLKDGVSSTDFRFAMDMGYSILCDKVNSNWLIESPAKTLLVEDKEWLEEFYYNLMKDMNKNMICAVVIKGDNFKDCVVTASWTGKFHDYNIKGEYFNTIADAEDFLINNRN